MCAALGLNAKELLSFFAEEGFWELVISEKQGWKSKAVHVQDAIYRNALDREHKDQWVWMQRFERMTGMSFLPHENEPGDLGL